MTSPWLETDRRIGPVGVLMGTDSGKYPNGNSVVVQGSEGAVIIDPSLSLVERGGPPTDVDHVLVSHAHEDHFCGAHMCGEAAVHVHRLDHPGLASMAGFMDVYGMPPDVSAAWEAELIDKFFYVPRPDARTFDDGTVFDLGDVSVRVIHLPGHTRGHCGFMIEPTGVFFVADIDLSTFGPYYGDHWSDLEDFERSIEACRHIDAQHYVTFHHKGIVDGRADFLTALDKFADVITQREIRMLAYLAEPHSLTEMVAHRFVYRPGAAPIFADHVEATTAKMHITRLVRDGGVVEIESGVYRAA